jgi:hypothetical protein
VTWHRLSFAAWLLICLMLAGAVDAFAMPSARQATRAQASVDATSGAVKLAQNQPAQAPAPATAPSPAQPAADEPIGNVATLTGSATVTRNNTGTPLKLKDDIYLNDAVATAANSSLGITFNDATTFTLKSNAQVTVDNYVYEDSGKNNSGIFDIAKGTVAFAAAAVAKTGNMQITTPTATLGIRGTTGLVEVPEGAAATSANNVNIKLYPDADGRIGQIEVNDRQGRRLGALTQGASGFAIRGGPGGARFAAVPLAISPQQAARDQGFVRQVHATQTVGRQIVSEQRAFRRANPGLNQRNNPARPGQQPGQNRPGQQQPGNRPAQPPGTPNNRPGQPQQGTPNRQGQQQQPPGAPQQAGAPARPGQAPSGAAQPGTAQPNALPRTPGTPPTPGTPGVGPRTGAAPGTPGVVRPGGPRLPALPKGKPPPPNKKKR